MVYLRIKNNLLNKRFTHVYRYVVIINVSLILYKLSYYVCS